MITIIFMVLMFVASFYGTRKTIVAVSHNRKYGLSPAKYKALSAPSKQILQEYRALPEQNRPVPNIYNILTALDTKHRDATAHFMRSRYSYAKSKEIHSFTWDCGCYDYRGREACGHTEYKNIHNGIKEVTEKLATQKRQIELARVEGGLQDAKELTERLRDERNLIHEVTQELT